MQRTIGNATLELVLGDITDQQVDAIVNAANSQLAGGGGVDGAIHRRGGPTIMQETNRLYPEGCPTGGAVVSSAGNLNAQYIFHAVGPIWSGGKYDEAILLTSAYRRCLELACQHDCHSIAFPSLSTGAYRYPISQAAEIALTTTQKFLTARQRPELVRFVLFSQEAFDAFAEAVEQL